MHKEIEVKHARSTQTIRVTDAIVRNLTHFAAAAGLVRKKRPEVPENRILQEDSKRQASAAVSSFVTKAYIIYEKTTTMLSGRAIERARMSGNADLQVVESEERVPSEPPHAGYE